MNNARSTASPRRVLVVGGTGFIARYLVPRLVHDGFETFATFRGDAPADVPGVHWVGSDLADHDGTGNWPAAPDTVIYLAQSARWRQFPDGAADVFAVNIAGVFKAAEYARRQGARRFIFASSGSVYDPGPEPLQEAGPFHLNQPRQLYAAAKLAAELWLSPYSNVMPMVTLRLFVPYGPGQSEDMLMPQLIRKVRHDEPILLDGGDGLRINPVAVADVVETLRRSLDLQQTATLNVAGPEVLSLRQIGHTIGEIVGRQPRFERRSTPERALVGDTRALHSALGWVPSTRLADGLRECARR